MQSIYTCVMCKCGTNGHRETCICQQQQQTATTSSTTATDHCYRNSTISSAVSSSSLIARVCVLFRIISFLFFLVSRTAYLFRFHRFRTCHLQSAKNASPKNTFNCSSRTSHAFPPPPLAFVTHKQYCPPPLYLLLLLL